MKTNYTGIRKKGGSMSTLAKPEWSYQTIREHERYHAPLRRIRFVLITDLMRAVRIICSDPDLEDMPYEAGDSGNDVIVPRNALKLLRERLPRFRLQKV